MYQLGNAPMRRRPMMRGAAAPMSPLVRSVASMSPLKDGNPGSTTEPYRNPGSLVDFNGGGGLRQPAPPAPVSPLAQSLAEQRRRKMQDVGGALGY